MMLAAMLLVAQVATAPAAQPAPHQAIEHVVVISVDGLRPEAIDPSPAGRTPAMARLMAGPHTLDARTDPDITVTLPNHVGMVTGRSSQGPTGHAWEYNGDIFFRSGFGTIHAKASRYVAGMFDVAHDHGLSTGLFAAKRKFWLLMLSYDEDAGAADAVPPDHGKRKLDIFVYAPKATDLAAQSIAWLQSRTQRSLCLVHLADPDVQGHASGWVVDQDSPYMAAVRTADAAVGQILAAIEGTPSLRGRTAVVLTTDHGGGDPPLSHTVVWNPINFRIPLMVWTGSLPPADLRAMNASIRAQPAPDEQVDARAPLQPIRNSDAANIALQLLGLPAVPGSTQNSAQDLILTPAPPASAAPATEGARP